VVGFCEYGNEPTHTLETLEARGEKEKEKKKQVAISACFGL